MSLKTEIDKHLIKLIQIGDLIETPSGRLCPANSLASERFGVCYYHAIVNVQIDEFGVPVHCDAIKSVWRGGVCVWQRGESPIQRELF